MVKTTKKLLNFLQSLNKCVQKKTEKEYLFIKLYDGTLTFPDFDSGKMYVGMEREHPYSLRELGITYD